MGLAFMECPAGPMVAVHQKSHTGHHQRQAQSAVEEGDEPTGHDSADAQKYTQRNHKRHNPVAFSIEEQQRVLVFILVAVYASHVLLYQFSEHLMKEAQNAYEPEEQEAVNPEVETCQSPKAGDSDDEYVRAGDRPDYACNGEKTFAFDLHNAYSPFFV